MAQGNYRLRDVGGRPRKNFVRDRIIQILSKIEPAFSTDVFAEYKKIAADDEQVALMTVQRYLNRMAQEERVLIREKVNEGKKRNIWIYRLNKEGC